MIFEIDFAAILARLDSVQCELRKALNLTLIKKSFKYMLHI